jgi:NADPH2 dehydrogenase
METLNRNTLLALGHGIATKNRIVVPAMASETSDENGFATEKTLAHYERLSKSGAGIILVEYSHVLLSGRSEPNQLGVYSDAHVDGLKNIATILKKSGAIAGLQIVHAGGKTSRDLSGGILQGPSDVIVPVKDRVLEKPRSMSLTEIREWQNAFLQATERAVEAGFDLVELHAAHGYGLNQWLSPLTNQRRDDYGHSLLGRARILLETLQSIRQKFPNLLLSTRIPGQDFLPGGLSNNDMIQIARSLVAAGVDIINVSSGLGGWRRPSDRPMQGYLVEEATHIQAAVDVPVIGVGGIEQGSYIDQVITAKNISLAAVGRAILADPEAWKIKHLVTKEILWKPLRQCLNKTEFERPCNPILTGI